jgi:hypothetical protein
MQEDKNILEQPEEQQLSKPTSDSSPPPEEKGVEEVEVQTVVQKEITPEKAALETAQEIMGAGEIVTLSNGYRVRFKPVSPNTVYTAVSKIEDPPIPMVNHPDGPDRAKVPNPDDPQYLRDLRKKALEREDAVQNVLYIFGMELVDPIPEDSEWIDRLVFAGLVDAEDAESPTALQKDLWFKKFIVADNQAISMLTKSLGISEEGIRRKAAAFKSGA